MLSSLAEYRLLFFGRLLLVVLWLAPDGVIGTLAKLWRRIDPRGARAGGFDLQGVSQARSRRAPLDVRDVGIAFGGIRAATDVSFDAKPGQVTSVIGPNGAGKTTVLNIVGGFYRADTGIGAARRHRSRRRAGLESGARRHRAHLSDHQAVRHAERDRQCADRAAARTARRACWPTRSRRGARGRRSAARLCRLFRSACDAGRRPAACRPPAGRDRARAGAAGPTCCCSTSPPPA